MAEIISIGAGTVDILIKSENFKVEDGQLVLPYSTKTEVSASLISSGGGASNSAAGFSRLGLKAACIARLGDDQLGQLVIDDLKKEGVETEWLVQKAGEKTDYSVILVAPDGGRTILTQRGSSRLEEGDFRWEEIRESKWWYVSSLEGNLDLWEKIVGFCQENSIKLSLNPGLRELAQSRRLIQWLKFVDFLLLNKSESEELTGFEADSEEYWKRLRSFGARITAVTSGRDGAYVISGEDKFYAPIINITPIDETGAGDAFGSGMVAGLINGLKPEEAISWGIKNSAAVVGSLGAKTGLLSEEQIRNAT